MSATLGPRGPLAVLVLLQGLISVADWMLLVFLQILVFRLTSSAFDIMLLVLCELVPMLLLGPWAGAVVDRARLKRVLFWSCALRVLLTGLLWLEVVRGQLHALWLLAALGAACNRFFVPAASALLPRLLGEAPIARANALVMGVRMGGMAAGTVLAGLLAGADGNDLVVATIGALLLCAAGCCLRLPGLGGAPAEPGAPQPGLWAELREALQRFGPGLAVPLAASVLVTCALGSFEILALSYVSQVLGRASAEVGQLFGAYGLGMLGGLLLSVWPAAGRRFGALMLASLVLMCACVWGLSQVDRMAWALLFAAVLGLAEGLVLSLSLLRLYQTVPVDYCARMVALLDTATASAFLLSIVLTGLVADRLPTARLLEHIAALLTGLLLLGGAGLFWCTRGPSGWGRIIRR
ncbi:MFS transporter [Roseateles sp. DAIF2]|uniref:MFS transporter n=1 Tax=Roseateles sp. DAIF2 TaxID=2714952 RepID=UPI0018A2B107|nr:MFS transporter [Roseateles sp. DAIF2]QPF73203.1 MFS transporter [Roseateles sp. DAIF2]